MSDFTNIFEDGEVTGYVPDANGDYYLITDYKRDFEYTQEQIARAIKALSSNPTEDFMILYGGVVSDSGSGQVDISAGLAIGQDAEGDVRFIILPAQSNVPMPSGWNDGRQIWVIGQHDWKLGSSTRDHKQTVTSYHYTVEDSYLGETSTDDLFVDADPTGSYVIWGSFTMTGTTFADQSERSTEFNSMDLDIINEKTADAGVTIEGVNVKDGKIVNIETDDPLIVNDTTESTTKDTGSIITEGGIGAEKNIVNGGYLQSGKGRKISGSYVNGTGHINELYDYFVSNSIMPNTEDTLIIAGSVYWSSSLCVVSSARRVNSNTIWLHIMNSAGTTHTLSLTTGNTNACGFNLAW